MESLFSSGLFSGSWGHSRATEGDTSLEQFQRQCLVAISNASDDQVEKTFGRRGNDGEILVKMIGK